MEVREILDSAADALMSRYPDMFKPSMKCKPPHLNADKFRDSVYESEILNRRNIRTTEELIAYIDKVNEKYSQRSEQEWREIVLKNGLFKTNGKMAEQAISKAQKYGFFLGLDASWMHEA